MSSLAISILAGVGNFTCLTCNKRLTCKVINLMSHICVIFMFMSKDNNRQKRDFLDTSVGENEIKHSHQTSHITHNLDMLDDYRKLG